MEQDHVVKGHAQAEALDIARQRQTHIMANRSFTASGAADVRAVADEVLRLAADAGATGGVGEHSGRHITPLQRHK
jgi:hypothetical protein